MSGNSQDDVEYLDCGCQVREIAGAFGPGVIALVFKIRPGCTEHTGPPNPLCRTCTDDEGSCTCTRPCGAITCTGGA